MANIKVYLISFIVLIAFSVRTNAQTSYNKYPSINNAPFSITDAYAYNPETIKSTIKKVANFQLEKYGSSIPTKNWLVGTFFSSFIEAYNVTGENWYLEQAYQWGIDSDWDIDNAIHADDVCPGQTYLDLYQHFCQIQPYII